MPAILWSGTVSFGMVAIPVNMLPAVRGSHVAFHLLHDHDYARLERQMRCSEDNEMIPAERIVRGAKVAPERYVVVTDEELEGLAVARSRTIEIEEFIDLDSVPSIYYNRPYYLKPAGADKPYRLLVESLCTRRRMGIARFVLHTREHLAGLLVMNDLLCLLLLHFQDEIVDSSELLPTPVTPARGEVIGVKEQIAALSGSFQPDRYKDEYQERVKAFLEERRWERGTVAAPQAEAEAPEETVDLLEALEESMARARERRRHAA